MLRPLLRSAVVRVLLLALLFGASISWLDALQFSTEIEVEGHALKIAIADTDQKRVRGLQHQEFLEEDCGMLFVFPKTDTVIFWMKDTPLPLSIAFMDEGGRITQIEPMEPFSLESIVSEHPTRFALEVNRGWFECRGITPGTRVQLPREILG